MQRGGGVVERGPKGHKLISSMQISENFGSNLLMGGGLGQGCIRTADNHRRSPPPPWSDTVTATATGTDCDSASGFVMEYA